MSTFRKKIDTVPRKYLNRWKVGRTNGKTKGQKHRRTLFHRTLPATARVPKSFKIIMLLHPNLLCLCLYSISKLKPSEFKKHEKFYSTTCNHSVIRV